jgi:hypothetical protein
MKSKTLTTWLALIGGGLGAHRLYLRGWAGLLDPWVWLHCIGTAVGLVGVLRVRSLGMDDTLAWWLIPVGGVSLSAAMLTAIVNGLQSDEAWNARHNPGAGEQVAASGWANIIGVGLALLVGAVVLMSTITVSLQHYFEA